MGAVPAEAIPGEAFQAAAVAIKAGDVDGLRAALDANPGLASAALGTRSMLHLVTDWPGHLPHAAAMIRLLVAAGADPDARPAGAGSETALHWAASSDDVEALDALLDAGADIEATGAVIAGGTPLSDAVAFGQWTAARRLVERGAHAPVREAAALGLMDVVKAAAPAGDDATEAFWYACHGGQREAAAYLLDRGAELNWVSPWDGLTPLDAARRRQAGELAGWLEARGATTASQVADA